MKNKPPIGKSMCVVFFRIAKGSAAHEVGKAVNQLWIMYSDLKKGVVKNLAVNKSLLVSGNLSVLIAYGPQIFNILGIRKIAPMELAENSFFESPRKWAEGSVSEYSQLIYSKEISENHAASDHFMVQLIADNEFFSTRALTQTMRELKHINSEFGKQILQISKWYPGFQSEDKRNWLGFHDGVSNMKSNERYSAIAINNYKRLRLDDRWLLGGTYLAFLRITIDLDSWDELNSCDQELIIGKDKLTGCPLIGVDQDGKPVTDKRCPVRGTFEVIQEGNEYFRGYRPYAMQRNLHGHYVKDSILKNSHIARALEVNQAQQSENKTGRIFRQGFEFLESKDEYNSFRVGLNFISFQSTPKNFFTSINRKSNKISEFQRSVRPLESFLSVHSAGIFIVPPVVSHEKYPGSSMFSE